MQFWINTDDIWITSHFIRKPIIVLSAIHENNSTGLQGWIHIPENSVNQKNQNLQQKKIVISQPITITSTFEMHYCAARKKSSEITPLLLSDFIESSQGCVVTFSGMHYEAIITKNKSNSANKSAL